MELQDLKETMVKMVLPENLEKMENLVPMVNKEPKVKLVHMVKMEV